MKFLTSLAALCLFGGVADWAGQKRQVARTRPEKQIQSATRSDTIPLAAQVDVAREDPERARPEAPRAGSQSSSVGIHEPPFLKHRLLFGPNSLELSAVSRNTLKRSAAWLREHREARILIVGFCDRSGSETCTHTLAEGRGAVVRQFLMRFGTESDQIVGVKGWDNVDRACRTSTPKCQQLYRCARLFVASSAARLK